MKVSMAVVKRLVEFGQLCCSCHKLRPEDKNEAWRDGWSMTNQYFMCPTCEKKKRKWPGEIGERRPFHRGEI